MEIKERIAELATAAGITLIAERIAQDRCWVDGRISCPYGSPQGQYILRPQAFCHNEWGRGDGCATYHRLVEDPELTAEQRKDAIREHFEAEKTDVTGQLYAKADELPDGSPEQLSVRLAADVLDAHKLDANILLEDDLPK